MKNQDSAKKAEEAAQEHQVEINKQILGELSKYIRRLGGESYVSVTIEACGKTLTEQETLEQLQVWNQVRHDKGPVHKTEKPKPMDLDRCIVYEVEVVRTPDEIEGGWENPEGMGFASAVAYSYKTDRFYFFLHEQARWNLAALLSGNMAISFNGIKFDSRVVLGNDRIVNDFGHVVPGSSWHADRYWWKNFDILLEYVRNRFHYKTVGEAEEALGNKEIHDGSFSLDGLAEGTLGQHKIGHSSHAAELYDSYQYAGLLAYNFHDVYLTKQIFDFACRHGFVVDRFGRVVKISSLNRIIHS